MCAFGSKFYRFFIWFVSKLANPLQFVFMHFYKNVDEMWTRRYFQPYGFLSVHRVETQPYGFNEIASKNHFIFFMPKYCMKNI